VQPYITCRMECSISFCTDGQPPGLTPDPFQRISRTNSLTICHPCVLSCQSLLQQVHFGGLECLAMSVYRLAYSSTSTKASGTISFSCGAAAEPPARHCASICSPCLSGTRDILCLCINLLFASIVWRFPTPGKVEGGTKHCAGNQTTCQTQRALEKIGCGRRISWSNSLLERMADIMCWPKQPPCRDLLHVVCARRPRDDVV
jgi:hypothetical protein